MLCPCGTNLSYSDCCEPIILQRVKAQSPEQLMRSRYSAYALKHSQYIYDTYAEDIRKEQSVAEITAWAKETEWLSLKIIHSNDFENSPKPTVEFVAIYQQAKQFFKMQETSSFIKENGYWRYLEGDHLNFEELPVPKRNDKCLCLSGKKYKKCCGN